MGGQRAKVRLRQMVKEGLQRNIHQERLIRRLQALWERRPEEERGLFVQLLATEFGTSDIHIAESLQELQSAFSQPAGSGEREAVLLNIRSRLAPEYESLASQLAERPQGLRLLLDLRAEALRISHQSSTTSEARDTINSVRAFEANMRGLFEKWFAPGLLSLDRISWN